MKKKKSLLLCLCLALAFSGTVATMASCGDDDKKPSSSKPMDYGEDGTYYVAVGEGEYTVVLQDGEFELKIGETTLSGDYKYDGEALTLKQGKKVIIDATLVDGVLKLTFEGTEYTFLAKVNYTVSFNVEGSVVEADTQTVLNGKKATKPANPFKEGHAFVGWYADSSYTVPYNFNETVSKNVVLYARFVQVDSAKKEFKITYEVDGEVFATAQTVDGGIYDLPTPVKEGKSFVGWWSSDFENATKLTAQVQDGAKVDENTTLYAVWKSDVPVVSLNASGATWTDMGVGAQYTVVITGPNGAPQILPAASNRYDFDFTKQAAGEYTITVSVNGKSATAYYNNKALAEVTHFAVKDSVLTFDKVANATKYLITVKCGDPTHNHVDVDLGEGNAFDFGNCAMSADGIKFTVKAVAEGYVASVSDEYVVVRNLAAVENLTVDETTDQVSWTAVENATSYTVSVVYAGKTDTYTVNGTSYSLKNYGAGEIKISVVAVAFGYNSAVATETTYAKARLSAPTNLVLNWQTLTWDVVEGATGYIVKIGDKTYETSTNSLALTSDNIPTGVSSVEISVATKGSEASKNSLYSDATTVSFGTMADTLKYEAGKVSWDPVLNVKKYEVQLNDGQWQEVSNTASSAEITFLKSGSNTIRVRCYDANNAPSEAVSVKVEVYKVYLDGNGGIDQDTLYKAKGDTVDLTDVVAERRGYTFDGWYDQASNGKPVEATFTFTGEDDQFIYAGWTAKKYIIKMYISYGDKEPAQTFEATYDKPFSLPTVSHPMGDSAGLFSGWFTEANAAGTRYTDEKGFCIDVFKDDKEVELYASFSELLKYEEYMNLEGEYTYQVKGGKDINLLSEVTVPAVVNGKKVTKLGGGAFEKCSNIKKIYLPDTIEAIEFGDGGYSGQGNAFYYCSGLEGVYIYETEGVHKRYYESGANGSLIYTNQITNEKTLVFVPQKTTKMTIDDGVQVIGANVFANTEIEELTVPASVKRIELGAFYYCDMLEKLTFLEAKAEETASLEISENERTFHMCKSLTDLTLPSHLNRDTNLSILDNSYRQLTAIKVDATAEKGGFYAVDGLLCYGSGADATIVYVPSGYAPENGVFTMPNTVYKIGANAFNKEYPLTTITTVNIGGHVTEIGASAFQSVETIKTVNFFATKEATTSINIASKAFYGCTSISSLVMPVNMGTLGANAFGGISGLTKVEINVSGNQMKLANNAFASTAGTFTVSELIIGENTPEFVVAGVFGGKIATLTVDPANPNFDSEANVLFNEGKKKILYVSATKSGDYEIPSTVEEIQANVFAGRSISTIKIPAGLKTIGAGAFQNCEYLDELIFLTATEGNEVALTIGNNAFKGAKLLSKITIGTTTSIALPDRTTSIGAYAFDSTALAGELVLPENLTTLSAGAYANTAITSVKILANLTSIPMGDESAMVSDVSVSMKAFNMFNGCAELAKIEVDANNSNYVSVEGVLYAVADGKATLLYAPSALTVESDQEEKVNVLNIPASITVKEKTYTLTEVASYAFRNMQNIKKIVFADSTGAVKFNPRSFAYDSFTTPASIEEIQLPVGVATIEKQMFYNCTALKKVNVPYTVSVIDSAAYFNNYALSDLVFDKTPTDKTEIGLELADAGTVKTSGSSAGQPDSKGDLMSTFFGCHSLTSLTLPDRTKRIGMGVFYTGSDAAESSNTVGTDWKYGITSVFVPANVTEIGSYAFAANDADVSTITSVTIAPNSKLETIDAYAFYYSALISFTMPSSVTTLGKYVFQNSFDLASVVCSSQIAELAQSAFENCISLTTFSFTEGESKLTTISSGVFKATALKSFTVPATVQTMKANVFTSCFDLETVEFDVKANGKSDLALLQNQVFNYCPKLTNIVFPETEEELVFTTATPTFVACQNLKKVTLPSTVHSIDNVFTEASALEEVIISPDNQNLSLSGALITNKNGTAIRYCYAQVAGDEKGTYNIANTVNEIGYGAFKGMPNIKKLVIPNSVQTIGAYAFAYMPDLEEVVFEAGNDTLTVFPDHAFYNCAKLKKVTMPDHLESMAGSTKKATSYAFYGCTSLTGITLPSTLKYMGGYMFANSGLQKITVPANVEFTATGTGSSVHGASLFRNCPELQEVELLGKTTALPQYFFASCPKLKTIKGIENVTYLSQRVFYETAIESIDLSKVKTIAHAYNFGYCKNLKSVKFGDTLSFGTYSSSTYGYTFRGCTALEEITLPASLTAINYGNFQECTSLKRINLGGATKISKYAFKDCSSLTEIVGIEKATEIGTNAFENCSLLASVDLSSATTIGATAFKNCSNLSEVTLNPTLTKIDGSVFNRCSSLQQITLPASLNSIGDEAFYGSGLLSITIPAGVSKIGMLTFSDCKELETVVCLGKVTDISYYAFQGSEKLSSVALGDVLSSIGDEAFAGCLALEEIALPDTLSSIGTNAFKGTGLRVVRIPASLSSLGAGAFLDCANLTAANVTTAPGGVFTKADDGMLYDLLGRVVWAPADLSNIDGLLQDGVLTVNKEMKFSSSPFSGNTAITKIVVQEGVTEISAEMFRGIPNVTEIVLPEGVVAIGNYAFADCAKLVKVNIPSTVKSIGNYAFYQTASAIVVDTSNATNLETIGTYAFARSGIVSLTLPAKVSALSSYMFYNSTSLTTLSVLGEIKTVGAYALAYTKVEVFDASKVEVVDSNGFALTDIKELHFGVNLRELGDYAVGGINYSEAATPENSKLEVVTFADNGKLTMFGSGIDGQVFANCASLKTVKLPNNLRDMGKYAFYNCSSLENISIPEGIETIGEYTAGSMYQTSGYGEVFAGCTSLKSITLPSTLKYLTSGVFNGCVNLETINLPASLLVIGNEAFKDCAKLTNIALPKNIYVIGSDAFAGCTSIQTLTVAKNVYVKATAFAGWTAQQTVNFIGDKYSVCVLDSTALNASNANFVFSYKESADA